MRRAFMLACAVMAMMMTASPAGARHMHNKRYKFSMELPDAMMAVADTSTDGDMYYDTAANVILMISERPSKFHSVDDYINCKQDQLEQRLRTYYTDSTLTLISCSRSEYYPDKSAVLLFHEQVLPSGFNTCLVYFMHHRNRDFQFTFTYRQGEVDADKYVKGVMGSLRLK